MRRTTVFALMGLLAAVTKAMLTAGVTIPYLTPLAGVAVLIGIPVFLLYVADVTHTASRAERLGMSVTLTLGLIMGTGLAINTLLPLVGLTRPLAPVPATNAGLALVVILAALLYRRHPAVYRLTLPRLEWRDLVVGGLAVVIPVLAVVGAVRLNNGASGSVTLFMLVLAFATFALMLLWRWKLHRGMVPFAIYGVALGLLLMTSMRGWYTTGHDVQTEYLVFQLAKALGRWRISVLPDAYNACLSITILPVMLGRWTHVADPYMFKVLFQFLFAFCPVLVYRLAHRAATVAVSLLATIFFVAFITFFQDMPSLNRQEIGFLFFVCALLVAFNPRLTMPGRRVWFGVLAIGMVVSHYSTTYLALGVFALAWGIRVGVDALRPALQAVTPKLARWPRTTVPTRSRGRSVIGLGMIAFFAAVSYAWSAPLTHTQAGLVSTVKQAITSAPWKAVAGAKSSDTSYSIFGASTTSPAQRLAEFQASNLRSTANARALGRYYDLTTVQAYPITVAPETTLPLTTIGRALQKVGLNVATFNAAVRQSSARLLQGLIVIGLLTVLLARRKRIHAPPELFGLGAATLAVVTLQVLLPPLSVSYGLLRAFQQALIVLDVFLVAGILSLVPRSLRRWQIPVAGVVALAFFASTSGILPQSLGGYAPALHLNSSGSYYNLYYTHPEELAAVTWLNGRTAAGSHQPAVQMDPYTYRRLRVLLHAPLVPDIYPTTVQRSTYVLLGYANVTTATAAESVGGDVVSYRYPIAFLDSTKDLIYSSGAARVYK